MKKKLAHHTNRFRNFNKLTTVMFVAVFTIFGTVVLLITQAATQAANIDPSATNSTISSPAKEISDASASGGKAVKFGLVTTSGTIYPDATNTGVPAGTTLTSCPGNRNITVAGTVIENCTINGDIGILADNVIIRKSKFNGGVVLGRGYQGGSDKFVNHPIIEDSEFTGGGDVTGIAGVNDVDGIYQRNNIHGWQNCMTMWTSTRAQILDSWCHDEQSNTSSQHYDGIELYGIEGGIIIRGNSISQTQSNGATAPLNITTEGSDINGTILIENNLMRSANPAYVLLVGARQSSETIRFVANNNRLWRVPGGGHILYWGGSLGRIYGSGTGNVDHISGAAVAVPSSN